MKVIGLATVILIVVLSSWLVSATRPPGPMLMDLAQLKLDVAHVEVVDQITDTEMFPQTTLRALKGERLVVATLKGRVPYRRIVPVGNQQFYAISELPESPYLYMRASAGIAYDNDWSVQPEDRRAFSTICFEKHGPFVMKIAMSLPETVTSFYIRYPTLATGSVRIPREQ